MNIRLFISSEKLRYVGFYPDFLGHVGKGLDKKAKVNFKIYDFTN